MTYHGGPVMHDAQIHPIIWSPNGTGSPILGKTENDVFWLLAYFFADFSAFPMFPVLTQYPDSTGAPPTSVSMISTLATELDAALPRLGTQSDPLLASDIESTIDAFGEGAGIGTTTDDLYVLVLPANANFCLDPDDCSFPTGDGSTGVTLGWHSVTPGGRVYAVIGSGDSLGSDAVNPPFPNGPAIDTMFSVLSHEVFESLTDPTGGGWFGPDSEDEACFEIADRCVDSDLYFTIPGSSSRDGMTFNVQQEWSNATMNCGVQNPHITSISPSSIPSTGSSTLAIMGTGFAVGATTFTGLVDANCSSSQACTAVALASGPTTVTPVADANGLIDIAPTATLTYLPAPPPPSCTSTLTCANDSYYTFPVLRVECQSLVEFWQSGAQVGALASTYAFQTGEFTSPVEACNPAAGTASCVSFTTVEPEGFCAPPTHTSPPLKCNGAEQPATGCGGGNVWHCCTSWVCSPAPGICKVP